MKQRSRSAVYYILTVVFAVLFAWILVLSASAQSSSQDEKNENSNIYTDYILDVANIEVGEYDDIIRTDSDGCVSLSIVRAFPVTVNFRGEEFIAYVTGGSVEDAIKSAGITLTGNEEVSPLLYKDVNEDTYITIKSDSAVTLTCDGTTQVFYTKDATVSEVLKELGITLGEHDTVTPSPDTAVTGETEIVVTRIEYKEETETEIIDYGFVTKKTSSMKSGTSKITQEGIEGEKQITYKNKYVDGVLTDSRVLSEEIIREAQDQIKLVGTAQSNSSSGSSGSSNSGASVDNSAGYFYDQDGKKVYYKKKLTGSSTAYYSSPGASTATGVPAYLGGVAVNPNVIPYGSKLYIVSADGSKVYGYATAVDTGGALMSGYVLVDVYYPTYNQCMSWGRRNAIVYVL
ncbi:MAG: ubiquitin-like domain-containing protein [Eubacteriales bacterium]|nr:ubiquitin-like domain-containing protein [Eubacteriales bacterium]